MTARIYVPPRATFKDHVEGVILALRPARRLPPRLRLTRLAARSRERMPARA